MDTVSGSFALAYKLTSDRAVTTAFLRNLHAKTNEPRTQAALRQALLESTALVHHPP